MQTARCPRGAVAKWCGQCPSAAHGGDPQPCGTGPSDAGEGLGNDHRIRVRAPEGEHSALALAQRMHRLHALQSPVGRHRGLEPATFGTQDALESAVISLDHVAQGGV